MRLTRVQVNKLFGTAENLVHFNTDLHRNQLVTPHPPWYKIKVVLKKNKIEHVQYKPLIRKTGD